MLQRLPTWLRAAIITSGQAVIGSIVVIFVGMLTDIQDWVGDPTNPVDFPAYGAALGGLLVSFVIGLVTAVHRYFAPAPNTYPEPPVPPGTHGV
jgi:hypothetical protein